MRVCFVSGEFPPAIGGIGEFTARTARGLAARGHDVHVVTPALARPGDSRESGVDVHRIAIDHSTLSTILGDNTLAPYLARWGATYRTVRELSAERPFDLVLVPVWDADNLLFVLDESLRTVTTLHTTIAKAVELNPSWRRHDHIRALLRAEQRALERSRLLHANSTATAISAELASPGRTVLAHFGVERPPLTTPLRFADPDGVEVLFVGRLERRKGVDTLLDAAQGFLDDHPSAHLTVAGRPTHDAPYVEWFEAVTPEDVRERVHFLGEISDAELQSRYAGCDIFCAPSRYESFGFTVVEAMAHGKPVVATSIGGITDVVVGNGVLVPVDEPRALETAVARLIADPDERNRMGSHSKRLFDEYWELPVAIERIEACYLDFAAAPVGATPLSRPVLVDELVDLQLVDAAAAESVAWALVGEPIAPSRAARTH